MSECMACALLFGRKHVIIVGLTTTTFTQESCAALSIMALVIHSLLLLVIIISMNFTVTQLKVRL